MKVLSLEEGHADIDIYSVAPSDNFKFLSSYREISEGNSTFAHRTMLILMKAKVVR